MTLFADTIQQMQVLEKISFVKGGDSILSNVYPEPVWVVPGLLPAGLTILAGRPKIGKSWLALQIAQAVASGGYVFDKQVQAGRVLFLALEDNERRLQERMIKQGWTKEAAGKTGWLTMDGFRKNIGALQKGYPRLLEIAQAGNYRLVVIDTLSRAFMGLKDINENQEVTAALSPLQEIAISNDFALMVLDHHTKPKQNNPNPIDDIMGATAKAAVLDTAMGLYRDPDKKSLRLLAEGRDIERVDITIRFDSVSGCWQSEGETESYIKGEREREVLSALCQMGTANLKDISQAVGQPKSHTSSRLTDLANKGLIEKIQDKSGLVVAYRYVG